MSASQTLLGRLFQSLGAKKKKDLPTAVDFDILGIIKWPECLDHSGRGGLFKHIMIFQGIVCF